MTSVSTEERRLFRTCVFRDLGAILAATLFIALSGCGGDTIVESHPVEWSDEWIGEFAPEYLDDPSARRSAMRASLVNAENLYSRVRIAAYGLHDRGWDALPEWNPRATPLDPVLWQRIRDEGALPRDQMMRIWDGERPTSFAAWVALGERVFFEFPLRSEPYWRIALDDPDLGESLGVERDIQGRWIGITWMNDLDGVQRVGITCALCHAARDTSGRVLAGKGRRRLDYGRVRLGYFESVGVEVNEEARTRWQSWGPGRADVLEEGSEVPIAIPDLWGLRHLRWLTQSATLRHDSPLALAIRQETQYTQANHLSTRPPRVLVWALTLYLYSLSAPQSTERLDGDAGAAAFERHCRSCHSNTVGSGAPVAVERVGTDPELGLGTARGTGAYRPSPLIGVGNAAPYFHHGAIDSLADLLSPQRRDGGHHFGTGLDDLERAALIRYLRGWPSRFEP